MKGDFSRDTFDPGRGYQGVLHQQGRMVLDADLNEQAATHLHLLRQMACDLIGSHGGPGADAGFEIMMAENGTILIGPGRYYVGGVLVEVSTLTEYRCQPFYSPAADDALSSHRLEASGTTALVYLDIFERTVSAAEDPSLPDPGLGGSDTALRRQTVWHVRSIHTDRPFEQMDDADVDSLLGVGLAAQPRLAVRAAPASQTGERPGYSGAMNGLFRVEIHRGGPAGEAQFKWSRENGAIVGLWKGFDADRLRLSLPDAMQLPAIVELADSRREAGESPGVLVEIAADRGELHHMVSGNVAAVRALWESDLSRPFARRWEPTGSSTAPGLAFVEEGSSALPLWTALGDGLEIAFDGGPFAAGDYWQVPVRPGTDLLWPGESDAGSWRPKFCAPAGPQRRRAPLAVVGQNGDRFAIRDLRRRFSPLT